MALETMESRLHTSQVLHTYLMAPYLMLHAQVLVNQNHVAP